MKFNPSKYSSSVSDSSIEESVEKGHKNVVKVDLGKFDEICKKFREKLDLKIKNLSGSDKDDFELVISYVKMLYGTSYYNEFFDRVRKNFKNVPGVKPGTVGGYFAGCLSSKNSKEKGCSINCVGSMPLPKDEEGWSFCDKAAILAEKSRNGYIFSVVKPADDETEMNPAYVFVESSSLNEFDGFSESEKDYLRNLGCEKVKLVGYKSSGSSYSELYEEPKPLKEVKSRRSSLRASHKASHRASHKSSKHNTSSTSVSTDPFSDSDDDISTWWVILIILIVLFILLLICYLGYRYYKSC